MSGEVFTNVKNIFDQLGIQIDDDGLDNSVYTITGLCTFRKVTMLVSVVHHYWPHFSQIWIDGNVVPAKKRLIFSYGDLSLIFFRNRRIGVSMQIDGKSIHNKQKQKRILAKCITIIEEKELITKLMAQKR